MKPETIERCKRVVMLMTEKRELTLKDACTKIGVSPSLMHSFKTKYKEIYNAALNNKLSIRPTADDVVAPNQELKLLEDENARLKKQNRKLASMLSEIMRDLVD